MEYGRLQLARLGYFDLGRGGGVRTHSVPWEGHLLETDQGWLSSLFYISYNFLKKMK